MANHMVSMERYSQGIEQDIILEHFKSFTGTFLDIGANDGKTFSNTRALALLGWGGVCVDPAPSAFEALQTLYADRPDITCIEAAITTQDGPLTIQLCSDTLVTSLDVRAPDQWKHHGFTWTEAQVEGISFATLLERSPVKTFDFINVDAEGHDVEIIAQMDLDALGCKMICVEHGGRDVVIKALCSGFRKVYRDQINLILVR